MQNIKKLPLVFIYIFVMGAGAFLKNQECKNLLTFMIYDFFVKARLKYLSFSALIYPCFRSFHNFWTTTIHEKLKFNIFPAHMRSNLSIGFHRGAHWALTSKSFAKNKTYAVFPVLPHALQKSVVTFSVGGIMIYEYTIQEKCFSLPDFSWQRV